MNDKSKIVDISALKQMSQSCRRDILEMVHSSREGHFGGAFSCMDILTVLYFNALNVDPFEPEWNERDRFILSKGHACFAQYSVLARRGFFPVESLETVQESGTIFGGHPDRDKVPGIDVSTGSLGHGLSIGAGIALSGKMDNKDFRVFVVMGDGEIQEGSVWEAAMFAGANNLDNLIAVVDYNRMQAIERTEHIIPLDPLAEKWESFGWGVTEVNGHDHQMLLDAFNDIPLKEGKPSVIIGHTTKGKGVSFMEDEIRWHARSTSEEEYLVALQELDSLN